VKHILFICTGNYYRSRFAEALFNHICTTRALPWRAFSRGLAVHLAEVLPGTLSCHTQEELERRGIPLELTGARPTALRLEDLEACCQAYALKEAEHRAYMREQFPDWENRITYWQVHDLDAGTPEEALAAIDHLVHEVIAGLPRDGDLK
jgi:protein-tyrosine phosphatase